MHSRVREFLRLHPRSMGSFVQIGYPNIRWFSLFSDPEFLIYFRKHLVFLWYILVRVTVKTAKDHQESYGY